jgi:glutamine synthetase
VDALIDKKNLKKDEAVFNVLREYIKTSKRIRFEGDGYGMEWQEEARRRKLSFNKNTPEALQIITSKESVDLFKEMDVMSEVELKARQEVELGAYIFHIQIEGRVLGEMVYNHIIPAAIRYQNLLLENIGGLKEVYGAAHKKVAESQLNLLEQVGEHIGELKKLTDEMTDARKRANGLSTINKKAQAYCNNVKPYFDTIREQSDKLEKLIADDLWPFTKYRELLFTK